MYSYLISIRSANVTGALPPRPYAANRHLCLTSCVFFRPHPSCAGKDGRQAHHCLIKPHLFIVWHLRLAISRANASSPFSRIYLIQAGRSDLKRNAKTFPIKFEYVLHPVTSMPHSAHERKPFCPTHLRILHHDAFSLVRHPGHLPARYFLQAPQ